MLNKSSGTFDFSNRVFQTVGIRKTARALQWTIIVSAITFFIVAGLFLVIEFCAALLAQTPDDRGDKIRNVGLVLMAFLGAPLVVWRTHVANEQSKVAKERMITDRFSKAVDQLGTVRRVTRTHTDVETGVQNNWEQEQPNLEVRLGGLYTLQRIFEDSLSDHVRIIETLCAYVRLNSSRNVRYDDDETIRHPEVDIQAAIKILGQRSYERCTYELNCFCALDLAKASLQRSNINSMQFLFSDFDSADLRYASLRHTDFRQAWLGWVNFQFADFHGCRMHRAALRGADLRNTAIDPELLLSCHGVKSGFGKTLLPHGMEPPAHWFVAVEAETESEALREAYFAHYQEFLERDTASWFPESDKQLTIDDIRLAA